MEQSKSIRSPRPEPRGDATMATILAWFVPGAGHLYLGQFGPAALAFAVVGGLFYLGLQLTSGMSFEFLDAELRGPMAPLLSPESGLLGGFVLQLRSYGFGPGYPRAFPETMRLGTALCATAGVLNMVLMVHANVYARVGHLRPAMRPAALVGATWLVPGLGHWLQGRRLRAIIVFALLVGLFVLGSVLAEGSNLSRERHFYYWAGQFMLGTPALVAEGLFGSMRIDAHIPLVEAGLVYGCVAGLLNILAMIDVYGWAEAELFGLDPLEHGRHPGARSQAASSAPDEGAPAPAPAGESGP